MAWLVNPHKANPELLVIGNPKRRFGMELENVNKRAIMRRAIELVRRGISKREALKRAWKELGEMGLENRFTSDRLTKAWKKMAKRKPLHLSWSEALKATALANPDGIFTVDTLEQTAYIVLGLVGTQTFKSYVVDNFLPSDNKIVDYLKQVGSVAVLTFATNFMSKKLSRGVMLGGVASIVLNLLRDFNVLSLSDNKELSKHTTKELSEPYEAIPESENEIGAYIPEQELGVYTPYGV